MGGLSVSNVEKSTQKGKRSHPLKRDETRSFPWRIISKKNTTEKE